MFQKKKHQHQIQMKDAALRQQALIIEKQHALQAERTRIAGEMHDDLGGGLTTIKFLSQKILRDVKDHSIKPQLQKVIKHSSTLVTNMSEIIWAMNAGFDTLDNLIAYSRRFSREYLDLHSIDLRFEVSGETSGISLSGEKRRNLFLIIKEALHNTVKHSGANQCAILYHVDDQLIIKIRDNGKGLPPAISTNGNGLRNMRARIEDIGGTFTRNNSNEGLVITLTLPLNK